MHNASMPWKQELYIEHEISYGSIAPEAAKRPASRLDHIESYGPSAKFVLISTTPRWARRRLTVLGRYTGQNMNSLKRATSAVDPYATPQR